MQAFREMVTGWLGKLLLALLMVPFAIFGIESYFAGGSRPVAAEVNGEKIYQSELDGKVEQERQQMMARLGPTADPALIDTKKLRKDALDGLINRELMKQQAEKDGFMVSDAVIAKKIQEEPSFQENGKFSLRMYEAALRAQGQDPQTFPQFAKRQVSIGLLATGVGASGFATASEVKRLSSIQSQSRDLHLAQVTATPFMAGVTVSDDEVKKFYDANPKRFTLPERVSLDYIELARDDFMSQVTVTDEDLKARYADRVNSMTNGEQRSAQHILIKADPKAKDAAAQYAAALKKIQEVEKKARAGEDFAKLAKEYSQDIGTVSNGGDLGMAGHGQYVPEFDKALFALKQGEISAPVKTEYGYHLIKLNQIQKANVPTFEALKPDLEKDAKQAKADELFADAVEKLDAATYEASDLKDPAAKFKLAVQSTEPFAQGQAPAGSIAANRNVMSAAFSDDLIKEGKNSQNIRLDDTHILWVRVKNHEASRLRPLAEVSSDVKTALTLDKANLKAKAVAEAVAKAINSGKSLAEAAAGNPLQWHDLPAATLNSAFPSQAVGKLAFHLPAPAAGKLSADSVASGDGYAVVALSKVNPGNNSLAGAELAQMTTVIGSSVSQQELQDYQEFLRSKAKIKITDAPAATADAQP